MIYVIISLIGLIVHRKRASISKYLFLLLLGSSVGAYVVGRQPSLDADVFVYSLYVGFLLYILFSSFSQFSDLKRYDSSVIINRRLSVIEKFATILGVMSLSVFLYIFVKVFSSMMIGEIIVQEYKNEGGAADVFKKLVPGFMLTISNFIAPLGYFFLTLHFHYLIEKNIKKSLKCLVFSLLIVLSGLVALSRSATVSYIVIYVGVLIAIGPLIEPKLKRKIVRYLAVGGILIISVLVAISLTRFSDHYTNNAKNKGLLNENDNPALFSVFDYFTQWEENAPIILKMHRPENCYYGMYNSCGLAVLIQQKLEGDAKVTEERERKFYKVFGMQVTKFHGVIGRLVYDFGFYGTFVFIVLFSLIVIFIGPNKSTLSFKSLLFLPLLMRLPCSFYSGNALSSWSLDIAIIFNILIWLIIKRKNGIKCQ